MSDTSPLNYLALIGRLELLPALFERVLLPPTVAAELRDGTVKNPMLEILQRASWIELRGLTDPLEADRLAGSLDRGEAEAIALSMELRLSLVLLDESRGRKAAWSRGLIPVGVGGVLVRSKARGLVPAVRPELDRLMHETNFRLAPEIYRTLLINAGEEI